MIMKSGNPLRGPASRWMRKQETHASAPFHRPCQCSRLVAHETFQGRRGDSPGTGSSRLLRAIAKASLERPELDAGAAAVERDACGNDAAYGVVPDILPGILPVDDLGHRLPGRLPDRSGGRRRLELDDDHGAAAWPGEHDVGKAVARLLFKLEVGNRPAAREDPEHVPLVEVLPGAARGPEPVLDIGSKRPAYYLLGCMNTDATLAGTIIPSKDYDNTLLGIIKEGTGTYRITGNDNYLSGALRILDGKVLVMNNRSEAEANGLRGALGAKPNATDAIAYVFPKGVLGGTGSIGGSVDNYGTIEPGADGIGLLTLKNYAVEKDANLTVHPLSRLHIKVAGANNYDKLMVAGAVQYTNTLEDFTTSEKMPYIDFTVEQTADIAIGTEFRILTANSKGAGDWHFDVRANKYTWVVEEREEDGHVVFVVRLESYNDMEIADDPDEDDDADDPIYTMGAFYDDGISDTSDKNTLKYYAAKNNKNIGVALCTYKGLDSDRKEAARQFNMMVCENEMKFESLQPSKNSFSFGAADNLVSLAQQNNMDIRGHCLVWHSQVSSWVSSDGKKNDKGWTREQALEIMKNHITKVMTHYKGKVREWDVVNECLDDDQTTVRTNPNSYDLRKQSVWQLAIGDDYIDSAFVYAHRADPDAILYLNDYGVELQGKAKSLAFYNLAVSLKEKGIPIHGVGLQCHFSVGELDGVKLNRTIKRFAEAGLKCIITELDMGIPSTSSANLEEQARLYRLITDIVLNNDNCPSMVIWGVKDNDSWRTSSNPLLYDSGMGKKPAWYGVRSALRHRTLSSTGINLESCNNITMDETIYDLLGRRVKKSSLRPGLYIQGGKKVVIK